MEELFDQASRRLRPILLTSITTLVVLVSLLVFGGGTISGFALAMTLGVVVGTYSSVFIASPVTIFVEKYINKEKTT